MTTETAPMENVTEAPDEGLLHRTFSAEITSAEGRTIDVRIVPYNETIEHNDGHGGVPKGVMYRERWMPGVFEGQTKAANRVLVNFEHQEGLAGVVGHGLELREGPDGFYGSFKLHENQDGDKALMLVKERVLRGVSLEAKAKRSIRTREGVVQRVKAHLFGIALTRVPAFSSSVVLALREEAPITLDEEMLPVQMDPDLLERVRALGVRLPESLKAHPAQTGTPDEGTPDSGTRPEGDNQ